jgi:Predicted bile acid beta-glucosidase
MRYLLAAPVLGLAAMLSTAFGAETFRPPSVPLVTHTPYFSIWSPADKLTDSPTQHWTGAEHRLTSLIRVDGQTYRLMGDAPSDVPALPQKSVEVLPLKTNYVFANDKVEVTLSFLSPLIPQDLKILSRPVTYVSWSVKSADGRPHEVSVYLDAASEIAVNRREQTVAASREDVDGLVVLKVGSEEQPVLEKKGDDIRIDWGYLYAAAPESGAQGVIGDFEAVTEAFRKDGKLPSADATDFPKAAGDGRPVLALALDLGKVGVQPVSKFAMLAYDEVEAVQYFYKNLQPYWRKDGMTPAELLKTAAADYGKVQQMADKVDKELRDDLRKAGGDRFVDIGSLAYRQSFAAHGLAADKNGEALFFSKENNSNGCMATVDITYPSAPLYLLTSPALMKAMLVPVLDYASSEQWKFPFAPHDIGTYPMGNGQVYGGGEESERDQMPVEESGNILILMAALAKVEGSPEFANKYWPTLTKWAEYLADKGFDPENQLCTDDFAGHLAHNVNLSMKAIQALGAYAMLCQMRGDTADAQKYRKIAEEFAARWMKEAKDGNHTRLAFDKPGTWSQKYNLVWDHLLGLNLFPADVAKNELKFYRQKQNKYGLPLDSRQTYTKSDWIVWSGALTGDRKDLEALITPLWHFYNETPDRVPMTDWHWTNEPKQRGFKARSVVGGVFIPLLGDAATWKKWSAAGEKIPGNWAKQPRAPKVEKIVPVEQTWKYTTTQPAEDWYAVGFNDADWKEGKAAFGTDGSVAKANTRWDNSDIWLRGEFDLPADIPADADLQLWAVHDEDVVVYINGIRAGERGGYSPVFRTIPISKEARASMKPGKNTIAVHCHQTEHGQMIDVGIVEVIPDDSE